MKKTSVWKYIKYAALGLAGALLILLIWGALVEPRFIDFREETAIVPNLPKEWENKRIALVADLQIGMWFGNEDAVRRIVDRVIEARPSAVLVAGDFVYKPTDEDELEDVEREDSRDFMPEINETIALLRPLADAKIPVFAVLGNHDYGMNTKDSVKNEQLANALRSALEANGVRVLDNQAVSLISDDANGKQNERAANAADQNLYLAGIGSRYAGRAKPEMALAQIPEGAPRIIFMHEPDSFDALPANQAPLALAAHTHGGQIRVPFTENWTWMSLLSEEKIRADGWIENYGQSGNRLYVNRGIGFSTFPVRINCRPELTIFTLRGGEN